MTHQVNKRPSGELNPKLFTVTVNNHTGRSSTTASKAASSLAGAQETAFAHNSRRKLKRKLMDAVQALADYKAAARSRYIHAASSKCSAKTGTGAGTTARVRERKYPNKCGSQYKVYRVQTETPHL